MTPVQKEFADCSRPAAQKLCAKNSLNAASFIFYTGVIPERPVRFAGTPLIRKPAPPPAIIGPPVRSSQYIFPEVRKAGGPNEKLVEVLLTQHQRGREITDYISSVAGSGSLTGASGQLADVLTAMARMYNAYSAWEDTIIFPAWKKMQTKGSA
jgi:hypothetical protein